MKPTRTVGRDEVRTLHPVHGSPKIPNVKEIADDDLRAELPKAPGANVFAPDHRANRESGLQERLQSLPGIASNLLTTRLRQLEEDGLILRRDAEYGATVYELTDLGARTGDLLFELAKLGAEFPPDDEIKRPGNLRTIAVTLRIACQRVVDPDMRLNAELVVDGEPFRFTVGGGVVDIKAGKASRPEATLTTSYEPMIAVADGQMSLDELGREHIQLSGPDPAQGQALAELMTRAMTYMTGGSR